MPQQCCWYAKKGGAPGWTLRLFVRTCFHKKYMWIFEHNFVADKAEIRRRAVARQVFFTQYAAKFAEKTRVYACEDRFLYYDGRTVSFCSRCIRFFSRYIASSARLMICS